MDILNQASLCISVGEEFKSLIAEETVERKIDPTPNILFVKQANKATAYQGEIITYTITLTVGAIGDDTYEATFSDPLHSLLQFVEGSLTVDGEPSEETLTGLSLTLVQNTTTIIEYQCVML